MESYLLDSIDEKEIIAEIKDNRNFCYKPEATVVIAAYNQTDLLIQNLNSLQTQTIKDFSVIGTVVLTYFSRQ